MSAEAGPAATAPTVTMALCLGAVEAAEHGLKEFGGADLLGYAISHSLIVDSDEALLAYAEAIRGLVAAQRQLVEAQRIAKWNAGVAR